jgi:integrase
MPNPRICRIRHRRHTYTTLLHANGEDVKVVQELLRHGSARITMDVYAQAVTPAKRRAQGKVVAMLRDREKTIG